MPSRIPLISLATAVVVFGMSVASAQANLPAAAPSASPAPPKNLQVFPKNITRAELISNMRFFSQSLGVRCTFCHVGAEGQPMSTFDFASDSKKEKLTARKMLTMVQRINQQDFGVTDPKKLRVTCFTCHRGSPHPLTNPATVAPAPPPGASPIPLAPIPEHKTERGAQ
jgi:hypothetical protein